MQPLSVNASRSEAEVILTRSYEPFGTTLAESGWGETAWQFTGEAYEASADLYYLRARWLDSKTGRFVSRDAWEGSITEPMSYNGWLYVYANPTNLTDPSGFNPNCMPIRTRAGALDVSHCAEERFREIVRGQNALSLVMLFEDWELHNLWGRVAGRSVSERLEWVLTMTRGAPDDPFLDVLARAACLPLTFGANTALFGDNDAYFQSEFRDNRFYQVEWSYPNFRRTSNQVGHFLTAVALAYYNPGFWTDLVLGRVGSLQAIIAHEKTTDFEFDSVTNDPRSTAFDQLFHVVSDEDYRNWAAAVVADEAGNSRERDQKLWAVLGFRSGTAFGSVDPDRIGNSLQDLRLSLRGWRFAFWVRDNPTRSANAGGAWLRQNILISSSQLQFRLKNDP